MLDGIENILPKDIEKKSFEIIGKELKDRTFNPLQLSIIKRVIHTTADFSYADTLCFSENSIEKALNALRNGASIITDTKMASVGINSKMLKLYGGEVYCFMDNEQIRIEAEKRGVTRASICMEYAASLNKKSIFAIGNAPTALIRLYELIQQDIVKPELIIGVPVGFVNVVASKQLIMSANIPYIVSKGRKGGSNVAAAICNSLIYLLETYK